MVHYIKPLAFNMNKRVCVKVVYKFLNWIKDKRGGSSLKDISENKVWTLHGFTSQTNFYLDRLDLKK